MSVLNVNKQKQSRIIFLQKLSFLSEGHFTFYLKTLYEKYAGGTKVQTHGTIVKYWTQNTHGTKWFWYDMTIIPEDIRKYMINRKKYYREEFKILRQWNITPLWFSFAIGEEFMQIIMTTKYCPPLSNFNCYWRAWGGGGKRLWPPLICKLLYWPLLILTSCIHTFYQVTDSGFQNKLLCILMLYNY